MAANLKSLSLPLFILMSIFSSAPISGQVKNAEYLLVPEFSGKDSSTSAALPDIIRIFPSREKALKYAADLPAMLQKSGYLAASVDSIRETPGALHIRLFVGEQTKWLSLNVENAEEGALIASGFDCKDFVGKPVDMDRIRIVQERMLRYYQNRGYPFARVSLDSLRWQPAGLSASIIAEKSIPYYIDSIRLNGRARIKPAFLQHYLGIHPHSLYDREKLEQVDKRLEEVRFLKVTQSSDIQMLGSGSVLNLYLDPQRSSQVDFLLGLLPARESDNKTQLTGDLLLDLKNTFRSGESILVRWQQLQPKSPRLNLGFNQPYLFNSPLGVDFLFDLFRKDSNFLQINSMAGITYSASRHSGKVFLQWQDNKLLEGGVDTGYVKINRELPPNTDVSSANLGMQYAIDATDYRLNPRRGNEMSVSISAGIKKIRKNSQITDLKDPAFDYASLYDSIRMKNYQIRVIASAAHYFPVGRSSVIRTCLRGGLYQSPEIFRNELFQIGGFRLLRGFDEESIYSTRYLVATVEYRYLLGGNSHLYIFSDAALNRNRYQGVDASNRFISGGFGINYQTGQGILSVCYAAGFRNDVSFRLAQASKLHFGYIYYF